MLYRMTGKFELQDNSLEIKQRSRTSVLTLVFINRIADKRRGKERRHQYLSSQQSANNESANNETNSGEQSYFWEENEHLLFIQHFQRLGKSWKAISEQLKNRNALQCRTHGQKYLKALQTMRLELIEVTQSQGVLSKQLCGKINKYESERLHLLSQIITP